MFCRTARRAASTFFGLMHGERIGVGQSLGVATGYVFVAVFLAGCAKFSGVTPREPAPAESHGHAPAPEALN